jgi:polyisoprenyl-phosphate glycosyltransferase
MQTFAPATTSKEYDYSIVVPVYNSSSTIEDLYMACSEVFEGKKFQVIFIDDASFDDSWQKISSLKDKHSHVVGIQLLKNAGQHAATFCGFIFAKGDYIITIDDDLQVHPKEILKLLKCAQTEQADVVYGVYDKKQHSSVRNVGSKIISKILIKYGSAVKDGSSFKLIHHSVTDKIISTNRQKIFLDELIGWYSNKTAFTTVQHDKRRDGQSGYSFFKLVKMAFHLLVSYTVLPLKFITWLGLFSSIISFGFGIYYIYQKINNVTEISGFTALIVAIFFSTGLILFSLGIIGEYLSRVFLLQMGKPPFKIRYILQ